MAAQHFEIDEYIYYEYYIGRINCLILADFLCDSINRCDTAILHCRYNNGEIDEGKYLSPIYKTIISVIDGSKMVGIKQGFKLICLR